MEFSSTVLIDFGLNLAGYVIAAMLVYLFMGRVNRAAHSEPVAAATAEEKPAPKISRSSSFVQRPPQPEVEFVALTKQKTEQAEPDEMSASESTSTRRNEDEGGADWRRRNRRAIYEEARRLLAGGTSRDDLLSRLPVTETELDMLTVTGKA
jgi:hypothetical protein